MRRLKKYVKGFYMSLGMFCAVPLPFYIWDKKYMASMLAAFPLVGLVIGTFWWLAAQILVALEIHIMLTAALLGFMPFIASGFIHLDGYMDTSDAILSRKSYEEKLGILKDSNVGAFAVVMAIFLFVMQFASVYVIIENGAHMALFIVISALSRCCCALLMFAMPHIPGSGYAPLIKQDAGVWHKVFVLLVLAAAVAGSYVYAALLGLAVSLAVVLGYGAAVFNVFRNFKGVSGDLLGYALVLSELCGLLALAAMHGRWVF